GVRKSIRALPRDRHQSLETARGAYVAIAIVQQPHKEIDVGRVAATCPNPHLERADLDHDLIVDREPLTWTAHAGKAVGALQGLDDTGLYELWQAVRPAGALQELHRATTKANGDVLAVEKLEGGRFRYKDLRAGEPARSGNLQRS